MIYETTYKSNGEEKIYKIAAGSDKPALIKILYAFSDFTKNEISTYPRDMILNAISTYPEIESITKTITKTDGSKEKVYIYKK